MQVSLREVFTGKSHFPLLSSLLRVAMDVLGVSQVQNPSLQSCVGREFLLLPDSWKSRRQQRLLRLALLLEAA